MDGVMKCRQLPCRFRIREWRPEDQLAGIQVLEARNESFADSNVHGPIGGAWLVCKAGEIGFEKLFLEIQARILGHDLLAEVSRKFLESSPENVQTYTRIQQGYLWLHVLSDTRCGVQCDSFPDRVNLAL